jgi:hypothetical protein
VTSPGPRSAGHPALRRAVRERDRDRCQFPGCRSRRTDIHHVIPPLPGSDGDLAACHDAEITTETIVPTGLADKFDLDLAIWACFANARITAERANEDQHDHDLAA